MSFSRTKEHFLTAKFPTLSVLTYSLLTQMRPIPPFPRNNPLYLVYTSHFPVRGVLNPGVQPVGFIKFLAPRYCFYEAYRRLLFCPIFNSKQLSFSLLPERKITTDFLRSLSERYIRDFEDLGAPSASEDLRFQSKFPSFMFNLISVYEKRCLAEISPTNPSHGLVSDSELLAVDLLTLYTAFFNG